MKCEHKSYFCLNIISMVYISLLFGIVLFYKKLFFIDGMAFPSDYLLTPFFLLLSDIVTEVYGFRKARLMLYSSLLVVSLASLIFYLLAYSGGVTAIPSSHFKKMIDLNIAYENVFKNIFACYFIILLATLLSDYSNMLIISKLKQLVKGKYFCFRSICSSMVGIILFSGIASGLSPYIESMTFNLQLIILSTVMKITLIFILSYPSLILCQLLRKIELHSDTETSVNYNPFSI